ncbi:MAG: hypothetical protein JJ895_00825 [Balneolaceae bacterium]|nr:hypothetical protein [Balneolaceae bacterium]
MKLDQKYFAPFIGIGAIITMVFIVFASFNFKDEQEANFRENTQSYRQLGSLNNPVVGGSEADSLRLNDLQGKRVIVLFWSSWSDKSAEIMMELDSLHNNENYAVVAALVKDATEEAKTALPNHDFLYIDGTLLFNELKVPGIPSYFLLNEKGEFVESHVGYKKGAADTIIHEFSAQ